MLAVYTIQYAQCNSNYGSIGGTTSMKRAVCAQAYTRGGESKTLIEFHSTNAIGYFSFKSETSSSRIRR